MKNTYALKVVYTGNVHTVDEYTRAIENARTLYFEGLQSVFEYCGGRLFRQRHGWSGCRGNIEYMCVKVPKKN